LPALLLLRGEPKTKIAGAAGGMALGGLLIKAAEKAFGIV
jgi:hypothetical protein